MFHRNHKSAKSHLCRTMSLSVTAALLLGLGSQYVTPTADTNAIVVSAEENVSDLRDQKQELLDKQKELAAQRNEVAATLKEQEAQKAILQQQIDLKMQEIEINQQLVDEIDAQIATKNHEIALKEQAIAEKEAAIEEEFQQLRGYLRYLSQTGAVSSDLQLIASANGFSNYLINTKAMELLSRKSQTLMDKIDAEMQAINADKSALEQSKADMIEQKKPLDATQNELNAAKAELDVLYSEINAITAKLNQDIDNYNAAIAEADADAKALQDKIDEIVLESMGGTGSYQSGSMWWPAERCNIISSTFKFRWGRWHKGIDICGGGCYGTPINAAASGTVTYSGWMSGYGWTVMINHGSDAAGRNITTLYAHAASLNVSVGQSVVGGQVIGKVGSSGNSTGPHLHFEVRENGTAVNPLHGYLSTSGIIINENL